MKNQTKNDAKLKLEKVMPKWRQYDRKWVQNRAQIDAKINEKTMRKNNRTKYCQFFEKIVRGSGKNSKNSAPGLKKG